LTLLLNNLLPVVAIIIRDLKTTQMPHNYYDYSSSLGGGVEEEEEKKKQKPPAPSPTTS